jgi:ABC-2 type transport system permease protein
MSVRRTLAVVHRVLRQLRGDRRTLALLFVLPPLLLWLVDAVFTNVPGVFARVGPLMLGLFPFTMMFAVTSIALLRERTHGTLERLMASPLGRGDLVLGYALAFTAVALVQSAVTLGAGLGLLGLSSRGGLPLTVLLVVVQALLGIALGLFLSAFGRTEFEVVQFMPGAILPQLLLSGLLVPVERMPPALAAIARLLPLTYAFEALDRIMLHGYGLEDGRVLLDLGVLLAALAALLIVGSLTLRRAEP